MKLGASALRGFSAPRIGEVSRGCGKELYSSRQKPINMGTSTDERGRIYLPKHVRDRYGDEYRIVELPSHVVLLPIDDDPIEGLREAVGDAFDDITREGMKDEALSNAESEVAAELEEQDLDQVE